jgi:hypothetical protein
MIVFLTITLLLISFYLGSQIDLLLDKVSQLEIDMRRLRKQLEVK